MPAISIMKRQPTSLSFSNWPRGSREKNWRKTFATAFERRVGSETLKYSMSLIVAASLLESFAVSSSFFPYEDVVKVSFTLHCVFYKYLDCNSLAVLTLLEFIANK